MDALSIATSNTRPESGDCGSGEDPEGGSREDTKEKVAAKDKGGCGSVCNPCCGAREDKGPRQRSRRSIALEDYDDCNGELQCVI